MGRGSTACCQKQAGLKKGAWTAEEDQKLVAFIERNKGHGSWRTLPKLAGLQRCGKSCRLRWTNYLRPDIKRGNFSPQEEHAIAHLHALMGNKWSSIASYLPGRTDNEVKNHWNTHLKKRLLSRMLQHRALRPPPAAAAANGDVRPRGNRPAACAAPASTQNADQPRRHARPLLHLLDRFFVSHMAQWEAARLEAEGRLHPTPSSSARMTDEDHLFTGESVQLDSSGIDSCADCTTVSELIDDTTPCTSALLSEELELDAMASCWPTDQHDILPYIEEQVIMTASPDQRCLSGPTSVWPQYLLDQMDMAMLPSSCYAC